jgi:hypothetical protein
MNERLDVLAGKAFDDLYAGEIEPGLKRLEARRQQTLQAFALFLLAGVLMLVIEVLLTRSLTDGRAWFPPAGIVVITLFGATYFGFRPVELVGKQARADVIAALCRPLGVAFQERRVAPPALERFVDLGLLPRSDSQTFEDRFSGQRAGHDFVFCAGTLVQGRGRGRHTVFKGLLFRIELAAPFAGTTVVLRDAGLLNRFECPPHLAKVALEDPRFEQAFEVFGSDQIESRALLTPLFMQEILDLERAFAGDRLRCAFVDGHVLVILEGHDRFEIGGGLTSLVDRRRVEGVARGLASVFSLIDSFAR